MKGPTGIIAPYFSGWGSYMSRGLAKVITTDVCIISHFISYVLQLLRWTVINKSVMVARFEIYTRYASRA